MNNFLPGLYIDSTPIGNLEDITLRALNVLKNSDKILCEDTRRSIKLLNHYKIKKKLGSYHKFNEKKLLPFVINSISSGEKIVLIGQDQLQFLSHYFETYHKHQAFFHFEILSREEIF